jgi:outer membrane protein
MKRIITVIVFAMICSSAFAQFNKGRYLVGGSLGFSATANKSKAGSTTTTSSHSTDFSLSPDAGYFIIDNLAVGAALGLSAGSTKYTGNNADKNSSTSVSLSPFVRYYLSQGIFFQGQVGFGSEKNKNKNGATNTTTTTKYNTSNWSIAAGYAYFLNDFVAVEPMIGYGANVTKTTNPDVKYSNPGLFLRVGFQIYLGERN